MRPNRTMTQMSRYGIELYATLEAETGLATGWKQCGSVNVAQTPERMQVLRKQLALARSFGVECHEISPAEAGELFPSMRTDDLHGAHLAARRRQGQPGRPVHVARQGRAPARREDRRGRRGHRRRSEPAATGRRA